ncbi:MAG TPA: flagellar motor protein MotB [Bacteroidetes bacterium]|nr:flagellar motor protein MotB [Bacteroidota bacterium]
MSTGLIIIGCIILIAIVVVQIGKVTELAAKIRGEEAVQYANNRRAGILFLIFGIVFLVGCFWSMWHYAPYMLGYGPHEAASEHGGSLDSLFNQTMWCTYPVFVLTHIALFWFAYKYQGKKGKTASFISHDNKLEVIWTAIPAVVMCFLVVQGLVAWNDVMADVNPDDDITEIEVIGQQFLWHLRYPGPDGKLGARDFKKIVPGQNPLGQDWMDENNLDDFHPSDIVLPVGKPVRVRITAMDVLHSFFLPHFRVKMDAVPGMPTYFVFTPTKTTEEYRQMLKKYPEYQVPSDPSDPKSPPLWKTFEYELACAELCGKGHFSMKKLVKIVSEDEYKAWLAEQNSYYMGNVRGKDYDPHKGELLGMEIKQRRQEFDSAIKKALAAEVPAEKVIRFNYVTFQTGSAKLTPLSHYELDNLVSVMKAKPNMTIEVAGHTDNTGNTDSNQTLSQARAQAVYDYLLAHGIAADRMTSKGYGETKPVASNDTAEGRQNNRRTEFQILTQ